LAAGLFVALVVAAAMHGRVRTGAVLLVNWLLLTLLAAGVAYAVTGASFVFLWPALVVVVVGWGETFFRHERSLLFAAQAGFIAVAFFLVNFAIALELVLSFSLTHYK